jgi:hypothetical protein
MHIQWGKTCQNEWHIRIESAIFIGYHGTVHTQKVSQKEVDWQMAILRPFLTISLSIYHISFTKLWFILRCWTGLNLHWFKRIYLAMFLSALEPVLFKQRSATAKNAFFKARASVLCAVLCVFSGFSWKWA